MRGVVGVVAVAAQVFSEEQQGQLRSFPDVGRDDLIRYFTLTQADVAFVDPGRGRGPADRLGLAVQLCTLPWLGFVPDEVSSAPLVAVARLAERLGLAPEAIEGYGHRAHTRSDHLLLAARYLGWKSAPAGGGEMKELEQFLLDRAMEHDSPTLLFSLAAEFLMSAKTIRPGASVLERMITSARTGATALTSDLVGHLLTGQRCSDLDRLLTGDAGLGMTRLAWLTRPAVEATASAVLTSVGKLAYLRSMDAHTLDLSMLPAERRRFLATVGRRSTVQALMRREERRYPILLALVAQSAVDQLDEVIALFDQAVSARESRARTRTDEELAERAKKGESRQLLMDVILPVLADPSVPDEQVGGLLRDRIGMSVLRDAAAGAWKPLPRDHGRLSAMDSSYSYLRQFTPGVLAAVDFTGGPGTADLMAAVAILKSLNAGGGRKVPAGAPASFVPAMYADYLEKARKAGDDTGFRHYWELCVILGLRDGLRSGDIFVPGSRRYADPSTYLYTPGQWMPKQAEYCRLVGKPASAADAIAQGKEELHAALAELETTLAGAFALFDLVGKVLSPRIRDLGKITMVRDGTPAETGRLYPHACPLLSARWNEDLVAGCWGDLLRMAGSLKYGQATASLIVGKWSASSRQNTLAAALKEWGTLRRTIHAAKYLSDPAYRRKIARQLNKGESLHALRRDLHYAQQGTIGKPLLADQTEQAWCLTVLTNSVITWVTEYYQLAVQDLRAKGRAVPDELLAHISPAHSENINFFGVITVDVEAELAKLDGAGWRPLRPAALDLTTLP